MGFSIQAPAKLISRPVARLPEALQPPSPDHAPRVAVSIPAGESGVKPAATSENSSLNDILMVERSHLPAQRRQASADGGQVISQNISVRTAVASGGKVVAIGGQAETLARDAEGVPYVMRELAFLADLRSLVIAKGSAFLDYATRGRPQLVTRTGSTADGLQMEGDRAALLRAAMPDAIELLSRIGGRRTQSVLQGFPPIRDALSSLQTALKPLLSAESLASRSAATSDAAVAQGTASSAAQPGTTAIEVRRLAQAQVVASDTVTDESPGLSGTFTLNGVQVNVAATDNVYDYLRLINKGAGPDAQGAYTGGSSQSRVHASYVDGKIRLESLDQGPQGMQASDSNGVLAALGLAQTTPGTLSWKNVVTAGQDAEFSVDGRTVRNDTNQVKDAIPGVTLSLKDLGKAQITVAEDASQAIDRMHSFVDAFNSALDALNAQLIRNLPASVAASAGTAIKDPAVQGIRVQIQRDVTNPVAGQPEGLDQAQDVGLTAAAPGRYTFYQDALASIARGLRDGLAPHPLAQAETVPSVFNALDEIGITRQTDGTLSLDEGLFSKTLAGNGTQVQDLFTRQTDGIANRLDSTLTRTLDPGVGILALREDALSALNSGIRESLLQSLQASHNAHQLGALLAIA